MWIFQKTLFSNFSVLFSTIPSRTKKNYKYTVASARRLKTSLPFYVANTLHSCFLNRMIDHFFRILKYLATNSRSLELNLLTVLIISYNIKTGIFYSRRLLIVFEKYFWGRIFSSPKNTYFQLFNKYQISISSVKM